MNSETLRVEKFSYDNKIVRNFAVAMVIFDHLARGGMFSAYPEGSKVLLAGHFGVDLFFAISGFLITSRLLGEWGKAQTISLGKFYARRVFRILPPAFLALSIAGIFALKGGFETPKKPWIAAWFFFSNYAPGPRIIVHFWSLAVEEHFYAIWPLLFLFVMRTKRPWLAFVPIVLVTVWRTLVMRGLVHDPLAIHDNLSQRTDLRLDGLLAGCVAALLQANPRTAGILHQLTSPLLWVVWLGSFFAADRLPQDVGTTVQTITAPLILVGTIRRPTFFVSRMLEAPPLRWFGRLSYSLYLFQQLFMDWEGTLGHPWLIVPVSAASFYLVEEPMIALGRDLLDPAKKFTSVRDKARVGVALLFLAGALYVFARVLAIAL